VLKRGYPPTLDEAGLSFPSGVTTTSHRVTLGNTGGDKTVQYRKLEKQDIYLMLRFLTPCAEERGGKRHYWNELDDPECDHERVRGAGRGTGTFSCRTTRTAARNKVSRRGLRPASKQAPNTGQPRPSSNGQITCSPSSRQP
jgi:hypothetical protein